MLWPDEKIQVELGKRSFEETLGEFIPYDKAYYLMQEMRTQYEVKLVEIRTEEMEKTSALIDEITRQVEEFTQTIQKGDQRDADVGQPVLD